MKINSFGGIRLITDIFVYGFGNFIQKIFSILIIIFLSKNLSVQDYGLVDFILSSINFASVIVIFGQDSAIGRFLNEEKNNLNKKKFLNKIFYNYVLNIIIIFPILYLLFFLYIENNVIKNNINVIFYASFSIFFLVFINYCLTILKYSFERKKYNIVIILQNILIFISVLYLVVNNNLNYQNFFLLYFFFNFIILIIGIIFIKRFISFKFSLNLELRTIYFAAPLGFVALLFNLALIYERFFIYQNISLYQLGIYSVAIKISTISQVIIFTLLIGLEPYFFSNLKKKNFKLNINLAFKIYIFLSFMVCFFLNEFKDILIINLTNSGFIESKKYIFPILIGVIFQELARVPNVILAKVEKNYFILVVQFFNFLFLIFSLNFFENIITINNLVWIISLNYFIKFIILFFISNIVTKDNLDFLKNLILIFGFFIFGFYFEYSEFLSNFYFLNFIFLLILSVLLFYSAISKEEIKITKNLIYNLFK